MDIRLFKDMTKRIHKRHFYLYKWNRNKHALKSNRKINTENKKDQSKYFFNNEAHDKIFYMIELKKLH